MHGRIDIHSHLLPGVDDGCASLEDSLHCARELVKLGYAHSFCTPHIWPNLPNNNRRRIPQMVADLQAEYDRAHVPLKLHPGGELNLRPDTKNVTADDLVTYAMSGKYVLIDMWVDRIPKFFESTMRHLQSLGATVILAHPERMRAVQDNPDLADYFAELGLLLQGNLQCLGDAAHAATRRVAEQYLKENRYFALGSDLHGPDTLPVRIAGLQRAIELMGDEVVDRLTKQNPATLL